ncbi:hypothetical protein PFISCL1PPCAC_15781 [Pristionchus fissidentatus]|uniref:Little elongation complex subunit 2 C-terminal domain-containing protein n=1 Tax=Pristionchus fissidentatus TaxID=1538716 RepID=A0AAV5VXY6_9BILA|nr:hypothetical protein PFISCL1PPCAC_15781 [Pristionchus fissidentatus]
MPGCDVMEKMRNLDEVYDHLNAFCADCIEAQIRDAGRGEELIFTDGPPSWVAAQVAKEAEIRAEKEKRAEMERKREEIAKKKEREGGGVKVNWASAEEVKKAELRKLAGQLSDRHLEFEIRKIMQVEGAEAAQMRLEMKKEAGLKRKEAEREKEKVEVKEQMKNQRQNPDAPANKFQKRPWQPVLKTAPAIGDERRSALSVDEQKRYVAIVANFHKMEQHTRFEQNKMDLKYFDERLSSERSIVDKIVRDKLKSTNLSMQNMQMEVEHVMVRWGSRYLRDQRRFERLKQFKWGGKAEPPGPSGVLKPVLERVLMSAPHPTLTLPPTMHDRITLHFDAYSYDPRNKKKSTTIHEDSTLLSLLSDNGVKFAMDATTAVHLMTRPAEPRNYTYNVPVKIFDQFRGGVVVRMVTLGKPRPQSSVTNLTLMHMVAKYRAKSTFIATAPEESQSKPSTSRSAKSEPKDTVTDKSSSSMGGESIIDNILGSLNATMAPSSSLMGGIPSKSSTARHTYGLYSIPTHTGQDTKLIIRSKPCPRNPLTGGTETALDVKVELACDAGAMRQTFEEMMWTSSRTIFKGAVNSTTIHVHPFSSDALQITHSRAIPMSNQQNEGFHQLFSTRTSHLSRLLEELAMLDPGEYLLQVSPREEEMTIFRENSRANEMFFNKAPRKMPGPIDILSVFHGIDERKVLQWQVMQGRAPLSLWPEGHKMIETYRLEAEREMNTKKGGLKRPAQNQFGGQMGGGDAKKRKNFEHRRKQRENQRKKREMNGEAGPSK